MLYSYYSVSYDRKQSCKTSFAEEMRENTQMLQKGNYGTFLCVLFGAAAACYDTVRTKEKRLRIREKSQ